MRLPRSTSFRMQGNIGQPQNQPRCQGAPWDAGAGCSAQVETHLTAQLPVPTRCGILLKVSVPRLPRLPRCAKMCQGDQQTWRNQEQRIEIIHQMYENTKPGVQQEGLKYSQEPIARSIQDVILETSRNSKAFGRSTHSGELCVCDRSLIFGSSVSDPKHSLATP